MDDAGAGPLRPLELISGFVRGEDDGVPPLAAAPAGMTARAAVEEVVRRALQRPPCVVSFSGGRDSSAVLAVAAAVARRDGLALPIPATLRFPDEDTDENRWQELVLRHLRIEERVLLPFDDELDVVGPYAREVMRAHGQLWPANLHSHLPIAERAAGGTVLTGLGGDELLTQDPLFQRVNWVLAGRVRPELRDARRVAAFYGPARLRRAAMRRHLAGGAPRPWLTPRARRAVADDEVRSLAAEPLRWDETIDHGWWRTRYRRIATDGLARVAAMHDARAVSPFTDPLVLAAISRERGRLGFADRTSAMRHLFGDLLPEQALCRSSKAVFTRAFTAGPSQEFGASWDGAGVDEDLVDVRVLRDMWRERTPDFRTSTLRQAAWLATDRRHTGS